METERESIVDSDSFLESGNILHTLILKASPHAIIAVDEKKRVILFNDAAERMFGFSENEMLGSYTLPKIIPEAFLSKHNSALNKFLKKQKKEDTIQISREIFARRKNGETFPIRINFGIYREVSKVIVVAVIEDLTEEKHQKKILKRQLRLAQLGEMLCMMTHQWRQPITAIQLSTETLAKQVCKEGKVSSEYLCRYTQKIDSYTRFLYETIESFRSFFRSDKKVVKTTCREIVESVIPIVIPHIESEGMTFRVLHKSQAAYLVTYASELQQVILNLIKNAIDVLKERRIRNPEITVSTKVEGARHMITVEDNAGGIDKKILPRIFDMFFTTKGDFDGTGIGLYMSKVIVEEHCCGELYAENGIEGARFIVSLPSLESK